MEAFSLGDTIRVELDLRDLMLLEDFNNLSRTEDMETVLQNALRAQFEVLGAG